MDKIAEISGEPDAKVGMHLILNCHNCDHEKSGDMRLTYDLLRDLPPVIDMKIMSLPYVVEATGNPGLTAAVYVDASALTIHTYPQRGTGFVAVDVYSCKPFDHRKVIEMVAETYSPEHIDQLLIQR